jgi:hypothetical protein
MKKTAGVLLLIASIISILVHITYFLRSIYYMFEYGGGGEGWTMVFTSLLDVILPVALLFVAIWMMKEDKQV